MSKPPMKALEQIKNYCSKTQCRQCVFGEQDHYSDMDFVGCELQSTVPFYWEIDEEEKGDN